MMVPVALSRVGAKARVAKCTRAGHRSFFVCFFKKQQQLTFGWQGGHKGALGDALLALVHDRAR